MGHGRQRVIPQRAGGIGHVKVVVRCWQVPMQRSSQVAVRIDQAKAPPGLRVRQGEIQEERRFAGAGLPDQIEMMHTV